MGDEEHEYRAWLCRRFPSLYTLARLNGPDAVAELEAIGRAAAADPVRDRLLALARRLGIDISVSPRIVALPGAPTPRYSGRIYACPEDRCARREVRAPGDPAPLCALSGSPLAPRSA
ncbi:hypothetical protein [Streptomyces sp. NPDC046985]|uniref:hypothetical protein n=1 Tax=Streptomyces sp. NPDC046985 TaxID=3155377 RepID=UPI0033C86F00